MNRNRSGKRRLAHQLEEGWIELARAERHVLRLASLPDEVLHRNGAHVRLHEVPVNGPGLTGLNSGVTRVEYTADLAHGRILNQAVKVPHRGTHHVGAAMI